MRACGSRSAKEAAQGGEMGDAVNRVRGVQVSRRAQVQRLHSIIAEMVVEPRPPGRAQRVARLQHGAQPPAGAAANEAQVPAALGRHQFKNDAGFAVAPHAEHNAFVGPLHGLYLGPVPPIHNFKQRRTI